MLSSQMVCFLHTRWWIRCCETKFTFSHSAQNSRYVITNHELFRENILENWEVRRHYRREGNGGRGGGGNFNDNKNALSFSYFFVSWSKGLERVLRFKILRKRKIKYRILK
jgi:hypothetical protein